MIKRFAFVPYGPSCLRAIKGGQVEIFENIYRNIPSNRNPKFTLNMSLSRGVHSFLFKSISNIILKFDGYEIWLKGFGSRYKDPE